MINKKKALLMLATAAICCSMASTAFAAPGKFNVKADELEYDLQSGKGLGKGNVIILQEDGKATANYANFDSKAKTGVLVGKVVVLPAPLGPSKPTIVPCSTSTLTPFTTFLSPYVFTKLSVLIINGLALHYFLRLKPNLVFLR